MPHYRDGTEAKVGDVVKGVGYNLKNADGTRRVFVGTVVGVTPGSAACNIQVAHVVTDTLGYELALKVARNWKTIAAKGVIGCGPDGGRDGTDRVSACVELEYGQCDEFEKIA